MHVKVERQNTLNGTVCDEKPRSRYVEVHNSRGENEI